MTGIAQVYFSNVAGIAGVEHSYNGILGGGVSFVDFNNDGLDDLTITTGAGEKIRFYQNNGSGFDLLPSPIHQQDQAKQILWVDYDNDHDLDLYVSNYGAANRLYRNIGQFAFIDVTESAGLPINDNNTFGACFGDIDRDGWLDLYYNDRIPILTSENRHFLFKNNADGTFTDIAEISQTMDGGKVPFCSSFIDYNNDKWPDIYTAHDKFNIPNVLLENNGDGTFSDVSVAANADLKMDAMCVAPGDYNGDGWIDIYITNTPAQGSALLHNIGPGGGGQVRFGNAAPFAGVTFPERIGWGAVFFDADNDGDLDLYAAAANGSDPEKSNLFYLNNGNSTFSSPYAGFEGDTTVTYSNAIGDYNADGYPDIIVVNQYPFSSHLWENSPGINNWLKIKLQGVLSNRNAIGSKIELYCNNQYQMRYPLCGNGFLGQNSLTEIFGLKDIEKADSIIITWPTGHIDKLFDIEKNQALTIIEGSTTNGIINVDEDVSLTILNSSTSTNEPDAPFNIYPVPSSTQLNIDLIKKEFNSICIMDFKGQILFSRKPNSEKIQLDISSFPSGCYTIIAINKNGNKYSRKWVKI